MTRRKVLRSIPAAAPAATVRAATPIVRSSGEGTITKLHNGPDSIHARSLLECARGAHLANQAMCGNRTIAL